MPCQGTNQYSSRGIEELGGMKEYFSVKRGNANVYKKHSARDSGSVIWSTQSISSNV